MPNAPFASLLKDLERLIGVPINLADNEALRLQFDGELGVTLAPDDRGNVVIDLDFGRTHATDGPAEMARLLLQRNHVARKGNKMFAGIDPAGSIFLTQSVPIGDLDAKKLGDQLQAMMDEAQALRRVVDGLEDAGTATPAAATTTSEELMRTQTIFLRV